MIVQVEAAKGMSALMYQVADHTDQRRAAAFEISRQQTQDAIDFRFAVKQSEPLRIAALVQTRITHQVPAGNHAGRAAAFKCYSGFEFTCFYCMGLEKRNRQKRNVFQSFWPALFSQKASCKGCI